MPTVTTRMESAKPEMTDVSQLDDIIEHFARIHGVSRRTAKRAAMAAGYGASREQVQGILDSENKDTDVSIPYFLNRVIPPTNESKLEHRILPYPH